MLDKEFDTPYCGVREDVIKKAKPTLREDKITLLIKWITERYNVHLKKDVDNLPPPWTDCKVLQNVKFTNVRREHDRATIWLIENVCLREDISLEQKMLNCILFRLYNNWQTAELIDMPLDFGYIKYKHEIEEVLRAKEASDPNYVFFTSAFNTGGMKAAVGRTTGEQYIPMRPIAMMQHLVEDDIMDRLLDPKYQPNEVCDILMGYKGIGEFLSYQMFVDFTYCPEYHFSENHFTIAGPGCQMGLDFLFEYKDGMTHEECIFWLRDNETKVFGIKFDELFSDLPTYDRCTNVMSLENCMCEFSKYSRCYDQIAEGKQPRARVSYNGNAPKSTAKSLFG